MRTTGILVVTAGYWIATLVMLGLIASLFGSCLDGAAPLGECMEQKRAAEMLMLALSAAGYAVMLLRARVW
jgi:hypothetical protein